MPAAKSLQSCPTLCNPRDDSPPGSPVPGIFQARTLEWVAISFSNAWKWKVKVKSLSRVWLLATPWTEAYQALPSMGFSRQEYWSGVPLPSPLPCQKATKIITVYVVTETVLRQCFRLSHHLWLSQPNPTMALSSAFSPKTSTFPLCLQQDCKHRASSSEGSSLNTDFGSHGCFLLQLQEKWEDPHTQWKRSRLLAKSEVMKYTSSIVYTSTTISQKYNLVNVLFPVFVPFPLWRLNTK